MSSSLSLTPGDHRRTIAIGGRERSYLLHVPPSYEDTQRLPVVLAFHGGATDASYMVRFCGLNETADEHGFLVAYPNGTGELPKLLSWNAGNCCGHARRNNVDDVEFVRAVLDELAHTGAIDERRIFATGMSNGAMMAYRLAAEMSDRVAAIAPVAGTMELDIAEPSRPVSVIHFHGTADEFVPFAGGRGVRSLTQHAFSSVEITIRRWVEINGCRAEPTVTDLPNVGADGLPIVRQEYAAGPSGAEVVLYVVEGGGHTWPGRVPRLAALGPSTQSISANDLMWEFFTRHPPD
ncbi:MAG TPA: PHB depolymerase family esterase [Pirellulales bacterium]|nr:PHB depolymerase family esterase [Pirellulales bacterium]